MGIFKTADLGAVARIWAEVAKDLPTHAPNFYIAIPAEDLPYSPELKTPSLNVLIKLGSILGSAGDSDAMAVQLADLAAEHKKLGIKRKMEDNEPKTLHCGDETSAKAFPMMWCVSCYQMVFLIIYMAAPKILVDYFLGITNALIFFYVVETAILLACTCFPPQLGSSRYTLMHLVFYFSSFQFICVIGTILLSMPFFAAACSAKLAGNSTSHWI